MTLNMHLEPSVPDSVCIVSLAAGVACEARCCSISALLGRANPQPLSTPRCLQSHLSRPSSLT